MSQGSIVFGHEGIINVVETLKVLKENWVEGKCVPPISDEAMGMTEDVFLEIKTTYGLLEEAITNLFTTTIASLEKTDEIMTETDRKIGESIGE